MIEIGKRKNEEILRQARIQGYQRALRECLDDLVKLHYKNPLDYKLRKVIDECWASIKHRLNESKEPDFKV